MAFSTWLQSTVMHSFWDSVNTESFTILLEIMSGAGLLREAILNIHLEHMSVEHNYGMLLKKCIRILKDYLNTELIYSIGWQQYRSALYNYYIQDGVLFLPRQYLQLEQHVHLLPNPQFLINRVHPIAQTFWKILFYYTATIRKKHIHVFQELNISSRNAMSSCENVFSVN